MNIYDLNDKELKLMKSKMRLGYGYEEDIEIYHKSASSGYVTDIKGTPKYRCFCEKSAGAVHDGDFCPYCGGTQTQRIYPKACIEKIKKDKEGGSFGCYGIYSSEIKLDTIYYVKQHPEYTNGILISKINVKLVGGKEMEDLPEMIIKTESFAEIKPGAESKAYKVLKNGIKEMDIFDVFPINKGTLKKGSHVMYENADNMIDFMLKHKTFSQYTAFMECFNMTDINISRDTFFMLYMDMYAQYPVIEFIAKMKHTKLISDAIEKIAYSGSKMEIKEKIENMNKVLNAEATKGSMAFTTPKFIADDLKYRNGNVEEFVFWGDICQLMESKGSKMSKEIYKDFVESDLYPRLRNTYNLDLVPMFVAYGYTLHELHTYIGKQIAKSGIENGNYYAAYYVQHFVDFLKLADLMQVTPDKFPNDLIKAHNHLVDIYNQMKKEDGGGDACIKAISNKARPSIPDTVEYKDGDYVIVLPESEHDIIQEGQDMRHCVGTYIPEIIDRRTFIFFIRKKGEENKSFVTAEYRFRQLNQIYYKNDQRVTNQKVIKIAKNFCNNLKSSKFM